MKYFVIFLVLIGFSGLIIPQTFGAYIEFDDNDYRLFLNNKHVIDFQLNWGSKDYPSGKITFDESINDTILLQIPKSIPRTTNLDFGSWLYAIQTDESWVQIKETESECFYILEIPVNDSDYVEIESVSVTTGRWELVTIQNEECNAIYDDLIHNVDDVPLQTFISPLKQHKAGVHYNEIHCRDDNQVLVLKQGRTFPACVNPETVQKLFQRNWALNEIPVIDTDIEEQEPKLIQVMGVVNRFDTFEGIEYQFMPLRKELIKISHSGYSTVNLFATDDTIHKFIRNLDGNLVRVQGSFLFENGEYWRYLSGFPIIPVEKLEVISEKENLNYSIDGAELVSITKIPDEHALNIALGEVTQEGSLEISIPRELIDAKMGEKIDDAFFVFVDQTEVPYTEIVDKHTRTLTISFEEGARTIEIIGVVPL